MEVSRRDKARGGANTYETAAELAKRTEELSDEDFDDSDEEESGSDGDSDAGSRRRSKSVRSRRSNTAKTGSSAFGDDDDDSDVGSTRRTKPEGRRQVETAKKYLGEEGASKLRNIIDDDGAIEGEGVDKSSGKRRLWEKAHKIEVCRSRRRLRHFPRLITSWNRRLYQLLLLLWIPFWPALYMLPNNNVRCIWHCAA